MEKSSDRHEARHVKIYKCEHSDCTRTTITKEQRAVHIRESGHSMRSSTAPPRRLLYGPPLLTFTAPRLVLTPVDTYRPRFNRVTVAVSTIATQTEAREELQAVRDAPAAEQVEPDMVSDQEDGEMAELIIPSPPPNTPEDDECPTFQDLDDLFEDEPVRREDVWWPNAQWQQRQPRDDMEAAMYECGLPF